MFIGSVRSGKDLFYIFNHIFFEIMFICPALASISPSLLQPSKSIESFYVGETTLYIFFQDHSFIFGDC